MTDKKVSEKDMELTTGLPDDVEATIEDAYFGDNKDYSRKAGKKIEMLALVLKGPGLDEKNKTQWYSFGDSSKWSVRGGGTTLVNNNNPDTHAFNNKSRAGVLVERMFAAVGNGDAKKGQKFFVDRNFWMTESEFYTKLKFHWKRIEQDTMADAEGKKDTKDVLFPDVFLGNEAEPAGNAAVKATETKVESPATVAVGDDFDNLDKILITLIKVGISQEELRKEAIKHPTLRKNPKYIAALVKDNRIGNLIDKGSIVVDDEGNVLA